MLTSLPLFQSFSSRMFYPPWKFSNCYANYAGVWIARFTRRSWQRVSWLNRGYYTVVPRYEFYIRVEKQYFTNERSEWVKYFLFHEKIKFVSSSRRVMFFLLYRQKDIDKIIEGNYWNYIIDKLWKINHSGPGCSFYEFYEWYIFE